MYSSFRAEGDSYHLLYYLNLILRRGAFHSALSEVRSLRIILPQMVIGGKKPRGLNKLLTVERIQCLVNSLGLSGTLNIKVSDMMFQMTPRLCCAGRSSANRSKSFKLLALSSAGKWLMMSMLFDAVLCSRRLPTSLEPAPQLSVAEDNDSSASSM